MKNRPNGPIPAGLASLPASYLKLLAEFPLRRIAKKAGYTRAAGIVHRLAMREGTLDPGEQAYQEVLEDLVERYDHEHYPMEEDSTTPTQALRALVEQSSMTVTQLGRLLGSKSAASELLSGRRKEPSKAQIARLCERFKVDAGLFLLPVKSPARAA
jgi:HTH-type transcriptional regulator/antitoxin HigA